MIDLKDYTKGYKEFEGENRKQDKSNNSSNKGENTKTTV